jgi:transposase
VHGIGDMLSFCSMKEMDGRKRSHEALEEIRIRAVKRVGAVESPEVVVPALGFHRAVIYKWMALYRAGGIEALKGRKDSGPASKLNDAQRRELYTLLTTHNPLQLGFEFALWTGAMVHALIRAQFRVHLSEVSVGRLLRTLGLSPRRPMRKAHRRDEENVKAWRQQAYPEMQHLAKQEGVTIYFADEASIRSDSHIDTTGAPSGETQVLESTGARFRLNLISAVSAQGLLRFMTYEGRTNPARLIEFLQRLTSRAPTPIFAHFSCA